MGNLGNNLQNEVENEFNMKNRKLSIVGLVGSPRKGMNTDILVDSVLNGCKSKGASIKKVYLNDLEMKPCQACRIQDGKGCRFHDGMDTLKQIFENSDGIVLGSPIYYSFLSSQVKLMIDRSYCCAEKLILSSGDVIFRTKIEKQKKGILVCVSNSLQDQHNISDCVRSWGNEINLELIEEIFISHNEIGTEARTRENIINDMFRYGELLYEDILKIR